jgi:hypothetical protein
MILYKQNKVNNSTLFMGVNSYKNKSYEKYFFRINIRSYLL